MNIGIDIDDTINKLSETLLKYAIKFNEENNIKHEIRNYEYDFQKAFGWTLEEELKFKDEYLEKCMKEADIKDGAREYIQRLKKEGNKIVIITARHTTDSIDDVYNISNDWLVNHGIKMDKLETGCLQKVDKCKENEIDVFIDDNKDHCKEVKENLGIPVIMFDSIYNQGIEGFNRVFSWKEAYEEVKKYQNEKR